MVTIAVTLHLNGDSSFQHAVLLLQVGCCKDGSTAAYAGMPLFPDQPPVFPCVGGWFESLTFFPFKWLFCHEAISPSHTQCRGLVCTFLSLYFKTIKALGTNRALKSMQTWSPNHGILLSWNHLDDHKYACNIFHNYHPNESTRIWPRSPQDCADPCIFRHIDPD